MFAAAWVTDKAAVVVNAIALPVIMFAAAWVTDKAAVVVNAIALPEIGFGEAAAVFVFAAGAAVTVTAEAEAVMPDAAACWVSAKTPVQSIIPVKTVITIVFLNVYT
jgi:hypothetical protein